MTVPTRSAFPTRVTGELPKRYVATPEQKLLAKTFALLDTLAIAGPIAAREAYDRAVELDTERKAFRNGGAAGVDEAEVVRALAAGEVGVADVTSALAGTATVRREAGVLLRKAAERARLDALRALRGHGEGWLAELLPVVEACIAKPDTKASAERWEAVHHLAERVILRAPGARKISSALSEHRYQHPDEVHFWLLAHAKGYRETGRRELVSFDIVEYKPRGEPKLDLATVAKHADEWGPTLLLAEDVIANVERIRKQGAREDFELPTTAADLRPAGVYIGAAA